MLPTHLIKITALLLISISATTTQAAPPEFLQSAKTILFLGDSITHAGHYISFIETQFRLTNSGTAPEMINLGLPSETCSGLSEPDHPFPRPDLHERLQRALDKTNPDVVVACYGMNDGIYYPFSDERFTAYQNGINLLIKKVQATGAKLILMSPPAFDPVPLKNKNKLLPLGSEKFAWFAIYENYDEVLARYSDWIMQQADRVDMVIDLHTPMNAYLLDKRKTNVNFTLSSDGVHINSEGHQLLATTILQAWGINKPQQPPQKLLEFVEQRQQLLHLAWLSHVGHKRPDVLPGIELKLAKRQAKQLEQSIQNLSN